MQVPSFLKDRAFWVLIIDGISATLIFLFANLMVSPQAELWLKFIWASLQPFVLYFLGSYFQERVSLQMAFSTTLARANGITLADPITWTWPSFFKDKAFWTLIIDFIAGAFTFLFANQMLGPEVELWFKFIWGSAQPFIAYFLGRLLTESTGTRAAAMLLRGNVH
jgi:hypothetical protein